MRCGQLAPCFYGSLRNESQSDTATCRLLCRKLREAALAPLPPHRFQRRTKSLTLAVGSLHRVAERERIVTDPRVTRHDRYECRLLSQGSCRCQMNRVQSANRFHRKGASGLGKDRLCDTHDMTPSAKLLQGEQCRSLLLSRDPSREASTKHGAAGLGKRESGRYPFSFRANGKPRGRIALKHGRNQCACFDVAHDGRALGSSTDRLPGAARLSCFTLRHGRYQSGPMLLHEGAGSRGSLPADPRPR